MPGRIEFRLGDLKSSEEHLRQFLALDGIEEQLRMEAMALLEQHSCPRSPKISPLRIPV